MIALVKRNLLLFFRDKTAVFFSLLSAIIIIGLYVLFLGDVMRSNVSDLPGARFLMDSWIMAGVLAVTSVTTTMGAFGVMIEDHTLKISKDLLASPISRGRLSAGYVISAFLIGLIVSLLVLVLGEAYILAYGGSLLPWGSLLKLLACLLLSVLCGTSMVYFLTAFIKSQSAFATASTIIGTLIGFLTGIYMPVGVLPAPVQAMIKIFPISHAGVLMRKIMMEEPMRQIMTSAPQSIVTELEQELGVVFAWGSHIVTWWESALVLAVAAALFYGLAVVIVSRKRR